MPELPEVENIRLSLAKNIIGQEIKEFKLFWPDVFVNATDLDPNDLLIGKRWKASAAGENICLFTLRAA